jgi:hypothetical protein
MSVGELLSELVPRAFNRPTPRDMPTRGIDNELERKGNNDGFAE